MNNISKTELIILSNIYLDSQSEYNSYTELANKVAFSPYNPIFQKMIKLMIENKMLTPTKKIGSNQYFNINRDILFSFISKSDMYLLMKSIMLKRGKFTIVP